MKIQSMFALRGTARRLWTTSACICFVAAACLVSPSDAAPRSRPGVSSVRLIQHEPGVMVVYSVILDRRLDTADIDTVAKHIRRDAPRTKMIFVSFFLRGQTPDREAWATAGYNPAFDSFVVKINETTTATNPPDKDLRLAAGQ